MARLEAVGYTLEKSGVWESYRSHRELFESYKVYPFSTSGKAGKHFGKFLNLQSFSMTSRTFS